MNKVFIEGNFRWIINYFHRKRKNRNPNRSSVLLYSRLTENINIFLNEAHHKIIPGHCLYIKAINSFNRNRNHGYDWKNHVKGEFFLLKYHCDHFGLLSERLAKKIVPQITQVLNKMEIKSNHI
jgi:hypothetical protein